MGGDFSAADLPQGGRTCLHRCNFQCIVTSQAHHGFYWGTFPPHCRRAAEFAPFALAPPTTMLSNCHHFPALDPTWVDRATSLAVLTRLENAQVCRNSPQTSHRTAAGAEKKMALNFSQVVTHPPTQHGCESCGYAGAFFQWEHLGSGILPAGRGHESRVGGPGRRVPGGGVVPYWGKRGTHRLWDQCSQWLQGAGRGGATGGPSWV